MTQHHKMERKNHYYPVFLFLMNFLKVVTKKSCHSTYTKSLLVKKWPEVAIFQGKNVGVHHIYVEKEGAILFIPRFLWGKDSPRSPYMGERTS